MIMFFPEPLSKSSAVGWDEESMCSIRRGPDPCVTRSLRNQPSPAACGFTWARVGTREGSLMVEQGGGFGLWKAVPGAQSTRASRVKITESEKPCGTKSLEDLGAGRQWRPCGWTDPTPLIRRARPLKVGHMLLAVDGEQDTNWGISCPSTRNTYSLFDSKILSHAS